MIEIRRVRRSRYRMKVVVVVAMEVVVMEEEVVVVTAMVMVVAETAGAVEVEGIDLARVIALSRRWNGVGRCCRYRDRHG